MIVFDHSPTALVAARGFRARRATLGTGFFCPLDESPLECLQPWLHPDLARLASDEQQVLSTINQVLGEWGQPPLDRLARMYHPCDEHFLVTFPELDHYPNRRGARYWGAWSSGFGKPPVWPPGAGKRIYAYLKPFPELPKLLELLASSGLPTIIYCDGIAPEVQRQYQAPHVRFENEPLDMDRVGRECDLAILNANHGTAVQILLAGKPSLQIPIHVEQSLLANAILRMGAGLGASPADAAEIERQFHVLCHGQVPLEGVRQFAAKYASFDPQRQTAGIIQRLEELGSASVAGAPGGG